VKLYNIDYVAAEGQPVKIVKIVGYNSENDANCANLSEGAVRLQAREATDLASLGEPVLVALADFKVKKGEALEASPAAIWEAFQPKKKPKVSDVTDISLTDMGMGTDTKPKKVTTRKTTKSKKTSIAGLTPSADTSTSASTEGEPAKPKQTESKMSKSKTAAKKKPAAKKKAAKTKVAGNGTPREGTKKAKLLALLVKNSPEGTTMAQMLSLTGWKACLGTARQVVEATGKVLTIMKDPEGKKATRWKVAAK
jgi:hypothetical protein